MYEELKPKIRFDGRSASVRDGRKLLSQFPDIIMSTDIMNEEERIRFNKAQTTVNDLVKKYTSHTPKLEDRVQWIYYVALSRWLMELFNAVTPLNAYNKLVSETLSVYTAIVSDDNLPESYKTYVIDRLRYMIDDRLTQWNKDNTYNGYFYNLVIEAVAKTENIPELLTAQIKLNPLPLPLVREAYKAIGRDIQNKDVHRTYRVTFSEKKLKAYVEEHVKNRDIIGAYPLEQSIRALKHAQGD